MIYKIGMMINWLGTETSLQQDKDCSQKSIILASFGFLRLSSAFEPIEVLVTRLQKCNKGLNWSCAEELKNYRGGINNE